MYVWISLSRPRRLAHQRTLENICANLLVLSIDLCLVGQYVMRGTLHSAFAGLAGLAEQLRGVGRYCADTRVKVPGKCLGSSSWRSAKLWRAVHRAREIRRVSGRVCVAGVYTTRVSLPRVHARAPSVLSVCEHALVPITPSLTQRIGRCRRWAAKLTRTAPRVSRVESSSSRVLKL